MFPSVWGSNRWSIENTHCTLAALCCPVQNCPKSNLSLGPARTEYPCCPLKECHAQWWCFLMFYTIQLLLYHIFYLERTYDWKVLHNFEDFFTPSATQSIQMLTCGHWQFVQYLMFMMFKQFLKTSPFCPFNVFFPLPSPPYPSCILPSHRLLPPLCFPSSSFVLLYDLLLLRVKFQKFWGRLMAFKPGSVQWGSASSHILSLLPLFLCVLIPTPCLLSFVIHSSLLSCTPTSFSSSQWRDPPSLLPFFPEFFFLFPSLCLAITPPSA